MTKISAESMNYNNRFSKVQQRQKLMNRRYAIGATFWLLVGFGQLWLSRDNKNRKRHPYRNLRPKNISRLERVATQLLEVQTLPDDLSQRLKTTVENYPSSWSAENPLDLALFWLAERDRDPSKTLSLQRYAMLVLYFSVTEKNLKTSTCVGQDCITDSDDSSTTLLFKVNPSLPECNWFGVTCSLEDQMITRVDWSSSNLVGNEGLLLPELVLLAPTLQLLWLSNNPRLNMNNLLPLSKLTNLKSLSLYRTDLQGNTLPSEIANLSDLQSLRLYDSRLGGVPSSLAQMVKLEWLWLHDNDLRGSLPSFSNKLTHLEGLTLQGNSGLKFFEDDLCDLPNLQTLWMDCSANDDMCICCSKCFPRLKGVGIESTVKA